MSFSLTSEQKAKLSEWINSLPDAYDGAIGGRLTYEFTPTTLGCVAKVTDCITKETIDLTDYESW